MTNRSPRHSPKVLFVIGAHAEFDRIRDWVRLTHPEVGCLHATCLVEARAMMDGADIVVANLSIPAQQGSEPSTIMGLTVQGESAARKIPTIVRPQLAGHSRPAVAEHLTALFESLHQHLSSGRIPG